MGKEYGKKASADFFMGANSPEGFYSFYDELRVPRVYVRSYLIKGGAGTGKSGILKKLANRFEELESLLERIHCSSDPNSLDGVIFHKAKCSVVDATPPHVIEPAYPGGFETVINLCEYFDETKMEKRLLKTVELQQKNNECHKKCRKLIRCASILLEDNSCYAEQFTDYEKIKSVALKLCKAFVPARDADSYPAKAANPFGEGQPREHKRLLSAVTNQGIITYENTVSSLCDRIIAVNDDYGAAAPVFFQEIKQYLTENGYSFFGCYCPLNPSSKLEHIIIPELRLGFITISPFHQMKTVETSKVIHFTRFTDMEALRQSRRFLRFNRRAAEELISSAASVLKEAKEIHDELEMQYTDAVDFSAVTRKTAEIIEKIANRYNM